MVKIPEEAKKKLADVHPDEKFQSHDGQEISSLKELPNALNQMPDESFEHHVNDDKHDVANWVEHSVKDKELANDMREIKDKEKLADKADSHIDKLKKRIHMGDIINKINSFTIGLFHKKSGQNVEATVAAAAPVKEEFPTPIEGGFSVSANDGQELAAEVSEASTVAAPSTPVSQAPETPDVPPMPAAPISESVEPVAAAPVSQPVASAPSGFPTAVAQGGDGQVSELGSEVGNVSAAQPVEPVAAPVTSAPVSAPVTPTESESAPTSLAMSMGAESQPVPDVPPMPAAPINESVESVAAAPVSQPVASAPSGFPTAVAQGGAGQVSELGSEVGNVSAAQPVDPVAAPVTSAPVSAPAAVAPVVEEKKEEVPAGLIFPK